VVTVRCKTGEPLLGGTSGDGGFYKPVVKGDRAERESEGPIVPMRAETRTPSEGRGPALVVPATGGKCEGMPE
jgi:hypothetical protein